MNRPLRLARDASLYGVDAIISHMMPNGKEKPVGYASLSLTKAERNCSQTDRDRLGNVFAWGAKNSFHTRMEE